MEDLMYWIIEYVKVFFAYGFLMFVWPSAVFRKYLKGKSVTFRFSFCVTVQVVIVSTVVLMLGLLHILNDWTMRIFFYGVLIWSFRDKLKITKDIRKKFKYLMTGTFGVKHLLLLCRKKLVKSIKSVCRRFWGFYKNHWFEYTLLIVTVVYGMIYFSWGAFHDHSYAFSDVYTHHSWIYQLKQGNPFSSGIYPEGMHCFAYALNVLFGVRIFSCLLYLAVINLMSILIAAYCFMKELFKWRYSAIFSLVIFLTLNITGRNVIISMARIQCSLPQEFAFPQVVLCALFLLRYLKSRKHIIRKGKESKGCWDENLLIFILAFAATIIVHFYATIMAFFFCLGIAVCWWRKVFTKEHFLPLATAVIVGLVVAVTPMVVGYASGIKLQGSLYWGMSVIQGSSSSSTSEESTTEGTVIESDVENVTAENQGNSEAIQTDSSVYEEKVLIPQKEESFGEKLSKKWQNLVEWIKTKATIMYSQGYRSMYEEKRASFAVMLCIGITLFWIVYRVFTGILQLLLKNKSIDTQYFDTYLIVIICSLFYVLAYVSYDIGLPRLLEGYRIGFFNHMLIVMIAVIPVDFLYVLLGKIGLRPVLPVLSMGTVVGIMAGIWMTDSYHGYLYFELTRYESTVNVTNQIIEALPENSYTIISPTDELYQVIEYGRHEELLDFCEKQGTENYTLPTEYVFLFVEKQAFKYAQYHFFGGPEWLANNRYQPIYGSYNTCPEYFTVEIPEDAAEQNIMYYSKDSDSYLNVESRIILEAKAYKWCKRFNELYPNELKTYYEDEFFVCYYFKQNPQCLYNLVIE